MAEMLPRHYIFGGIIFTMLVVGIFSVFNLIEKGGVGDGTDATPGFVQSNQLGEFNRSFNKIDNITTDVGKLETKMSELKPEDVGVISLSIAFITTAWDAMGVIIKMFGFMNSAFLGLTSILGVPLWIPTLIILLVVVVIVFGVLSTIFGKDT